MAQTIRQYLNSTYTNSSNSANMEAFKQDVYEYSVTSGGYKWLKWLIEESSHPTKAYYLDNVISLMESVGITHLTTWVNLCGSLDQINIPVLLQTIDPQIPQIIGTPLHGYSLKAETSDKFPKAMSSNWDSMYTIPSYDEFVNLMKVCPSKRFQYIKERRDCEDFRRILRGWLSELGMGNLTVGVCDYKGYMLGEHVFSHDVVVCLTGDGWICGEPQTDEVWPADVCQPSRKDIDSYKIYKILF